MNLNKIYQQAVTPTKDFPGEDLAQKQMDEEAQRVQREMWLQHPNTINLLDLLKSLSANAHFNNLSMANDAAKYFPQIQSNLIIQQTIERTITYARTGKFTS
jgi:hypothetical protein